MGIINVITEWNKARQERHMSSMEETNRCPQCSGKGFHSYAGHEFTFHGSILDCESCQGSGLFTDWQSLH